ncbi:hypothetical protein Asp14428_44440 [Actinoplanes sp. NBRC 14428]|nr:hypothetical protein Asp14428_44440 [Actinoplanes sp. NBRC 14428]
MRRTLDAWSGDAVTASDRRIAEVSARVSDTARRLAQRSTPDGDRARLVAAWSSRGLPPAGLEGVPRRPPPGEARILAAVRGDHPDLPDSDHALLAGDEHIAAERYSHRIVAGHADDNDWAGLVVALGGAARPELPRDAYPLLAANGRAADPRDLVRWCATAG